MTRDFDSEQLKKGMAKEMESMDYFGIYYEVPVEQLSEQERDVVIGTRWVLRQKGDEAR